MAELPASVTQARTAAQQATATAGQLGAMEPSISDALRQKITEAYANNQDIVGPLDVATTQYLGAPAAAREKYQNIFNPFARENLVSQYQANKALPMLMYSNIMGNRMNTAEDIIGAGTRAFQSQVAAKQAAAQAAQQTYQDVLNEYTITEQIRQQQEAEKLAREKFEYDKGTSSGGGWGGTGLGETPWEYMTEEAAKEIGKQPGYINIYNQPTESYGEPTGRYPNYMEQISGRYQAGPRQVSYGDIQNAGRSAINWLTGAIKSGLEKAKETAKKSKSRSRA